MAGALKGDLELVEKRGVRKGKERERATHLLRLRLRLDLMHCLKRVYV
jgi:hypothetical protein